MDYELERYVCQFCEEKGHLQNMLCCANTSCPISFHLDCLSLGLVLELLENTDPTAFLCDECYDAVEELGWLSGNSDSDNDDSA